jgi:hypothetical protein
MTEMTIFTNQTAGSSPREMSNLTKTLASSSTSRRIVANNNGTFKRIFNGEPIGKPLRGELNLIVINALPNVSRIYYEKDYDPEGEPTLPNCWSSLGDVPDEKSSDKQSKDCMSCPQNVKGSGKLGGRACRYQRRLAVIVEGDTSGNVYQFNVPAKSLFGKGIGNTHPFESYVKFLIANEFSIDNVVTTVAFDDEEEGMVLNFTPAREITDDEYTLVQQLQASPDATRYTQITVAQTDGVAKLPNKTEEKAEAKEEKVTYADEPDDDDTPPEPKPAKRGKKKTTKKAAAKKEEHEDLSDVVSKWAADDEPE